MSYSRDPRWLDARFAGKCAGCGAAFRKGDRIFYFPIGKRAVSGECAERAAAEFRAMVADEAYA